MRKLLLLLLLLGIAPAQAADNTVVITPGVGVTVRSHDVGAGVQSALSIPGDASGNIAWGTAGTANANILTVQGIAAMTPLLATVTGTVAATQSGTWIVQGTGATSAALSGNPFRVALSDGTNTQNWLAAIGLTDAVNGNNMGAVGTYMWNGTTWDRMPGTAALGLKTAHVSGSVASGAFASGSIASGAMVDLGAQADAACSTDNGSCSLIALVKRNNQNITNPATLTASSTGGCVPGVKMMTGASTNSLSLTATTSTLCSLNIIQTTTTLGDLRIYDSASAPTCSSATGVVANIPVQSNAVSAGSVIQLGNFGHAFVNGIGICFTGAVANNDNTSWGGATNGVAINYATK